MVLEDKTLMQLQNNKPTFSREIRARVWNKSMAEDGSIILTLASIGITAMILSRSDVVYAKVKKLKFRRTLTIMT